MSLRGHRIGAAAQVPIERFLIVGVGAQLFALSAELVQELLTLDESGSSSTLTVQGQEYPPVSLVERFGLASSDNTTETRSVLLAQAGMRACIRVDQVHGLVDVERTRVLPLPRQFRSHERNWYFGILLFGNGVAVGLNSMWLLNGATPESCGVSAQEQRVPLSLCGPSDRMGKGVAC